MYLNIFLFYKFRVKNTRVTLEYMYLYVIYNERMLYRTKFQNELICYRFISYMYI